jgi:phosphoglycolate phosphatase
MKYDAVLFDLDGTLLDTLEDLADAANGALQSRGFPTHPLDAYRYFVGDGVRKLMLRALPGKRAADAVFVDEMVGEMRRRYSENWDNKTQPYAGVPELLDGLSQRGIPFCVVSNKPQDFTDLCVQRLLGDWTFGTIIGVSDAIPPKPDPTGARRAADVLGVPTERFLYLGDTNTDMKTAVAAAMFPVGAAWGFRPVEELQGNGARAIVQDPTDLLTLQAR